MSPIHNCLSGTRFLAPNIHVIVVCTSIISGTTIVGSNPYLLWSYDLWHNDYGPMVWRLCYGVALTVLWSSTDSMAYKNEHNALHDMANVPTLFTYPNDPCTYNLVDCLCDYGYGNSDSHVHISMAIL